MDIRKLEVREELCRFDGLFGILSRPPAETEHPAVVLFNAGSVHHVGPHRLYVTLARRLAEAGYPCLRFDLRGIGDSASSPRENHPYPESAVGDARAALQYLTQCGCRRFVLMGLCSGAHTAFRAAVELREFDIAEIVLINPLTFRWREGMSLDTSELARSALRYRKAVRDPQRWLRLLRGKIDFRRLARYVASLFKSSDDDEVKRDLRRLHSLGRRMTMLIAEGDPGEHILKRSAGRAAEQVQVQTIAAADHTFSRAAPRAELIERLLELSRSWRPKASPPSPTS